MANQKPQFGQEWQRAQMLKQNTVRIKFGDLSPAVQKAIGFRRREDYDMWLEMHQLPLRTRRFYRGLSEITGLGGMADMVYSALRKGYLDMGLGGGFVSIAGLLRTAVARAIQEKHSEIAETAKKFGLLQTQNEKEYPTDWINPATVAQTHPIFSVTRNGDVIFRRVTPLEFKLLKAQEGWRGKTGLNVSVDPRKLLWRWRGTLRKPLAPEVERKRVLERLRGLARRYLPMPQPRPAPVLVRKTRSRRITAWRR